MNKAYEIYSERLPMMADHFVKEAQEKPEKFRIDISLQYSVFIRVYDSETDNLLFEYSTQDNCNKQSYKNLTFFRNGYMYDAISSPNVCDLSISKHGQEFAKQTILERSYLEDVNFCFIDFERIFYEFLKSTF